MKITESKLRQIIRETIISEARKGYGYEDSKLRYRDIDGKGKKEELYVDEWLQLRKRNDLINKIRNEKDPELKRKYIKVLNKYHAEMTPSEREELKLSTPNIPGMHNFDEDDIVSFDEMNPDPKFPPNSALPTEYDRTIRDSNDTDYGASRDPQSPGRLSDEEYRRLVDKKNDRYYRHDFRGKIGKKLSR
jgi:hypothetical protein